MKGYWYLLILIIVFSFSSCDKDELTMPTEVSLEFSMESFSENGAKSSRFYIEEGTMLISSFEFDGNREEGEDYYFSSQFDMPLSAEMHSGNTNQSVSFDVPQGIYTKIDLIFSLGSENENSLILNGAYVHGPSTVIPIRIEYAYQERINVRCTGQNGTGQVILKKGNLIQAKVKFKTSGFFQLVGYGMIQRAETVDIDGVKTILINNNVNTDIFNLLASRIDDSIQVVFE